MAKRIWIVKYRVRPLSYPEIVGKLEIQEVEAFDFVDAIREFSRVCINMNLEADGKTSDLVDISEKE